MTELTTTGEDLLATVWAALEETGVWVAPELRDEVSVDDQAAIEAAVADSAVPLYVVLQPLTESDAFGGEPEELLTQLHDRYDADGLYLAPRFYSDPQQFTVLDRAWGTDLDPWQAVAVAQQRHGDAEGRVDDLGAFVADATRLIADGDAARAYEDEVASARTGTSTGSPGGSSGPDGGPATGVVVGAVVGLLVFGVVVVRLRRSRRPRSFTLPDSVVAQVREAHADRVEQDARREVLELGDAVRTSDLATGDDTDAWQAALDHYDAATRVLDGPSDLALLDGVGALVLARQGRAALAAATAGKPFRPLRLCYLNPLHETPGRTPLRLEQHGQTLQVPVCPACRADLKAGRDPDALRVERHRRAVLYVDSEAEPWASTAYGALGESLVTALHRAP